MKEEIQLLEHCKVKQLLCYLISAAPVDFALKVTTAFWCWLNLIKNTVAHHEQCTHSSTQQLSAISG